MTFLVIKSIHLITMVSWFAGLFYIFRLFVYHVENRHKPDVVQTLALMEDKLYRLIMQPAMLVTWLMGLWMLLLYPNVFLFKWIFLKLFLVVLLVGYHFFARHTYFEFLKGNYFLTSKQCRLLNEFPTLILISVVFLAVLKPF